MSLLVYVTSAATSDHRNTPNQRRGTDMVKNKTQVKNSVPDWYSCREPVQCQHPSNLASITAFTT